MRYCLCLYDLKGNLLGTRLWSCLGCGVKHMPKTPACLRKENKNGEIVRRNLSFIKIEKKIK